MDKKSKRKLFDQTFHKATLIQPGQASTLTEEEDTELRKYLYPRPFPGDVPCTQCGQPTLNADRKKPARCNRGVRICGYCVWWMLRKEKYALL